MNSFDWITQAQNAKTVKAWEKISLAKGMAVFQPDSDRNFEEVLHRADQLMYEDKRRTKGQAK
jgi:GGDEF domain-containing protein